MENKKLPTEIWDPEKLGSDKTELQSALTESKGSALQKYQKIVTGSSSLSKLFKHELIMTIFGPLPGAAGLVLRKKFFTTLIGDVGQNVIFGKSLTLRHPHKIHIGNNVVIDDYAVLDAKGETNKGIFIGDNVIIGRNTVISCKNGDIFIGDNSNMAMSCFIQSANKTG